MQIKYHTLNVIVLFVTRLRKRTLYSTLKCLYNSIMNYISTTDLRKKSSVLRDSLQRGENTYLVHRSKVIGVVEPYEEDVKVFTPAKLEAFISAFPVKKPISYKKRKSIHTKHLLEKYGKGIS